MWHLHRWSKWEDTKIGDVLSAPPGWPYPFARQVIIQQCRCSICNMVKTRRA